MIGHDYHQTRVFIGYAIFTAMPALPSVEVTIEKSTIVYQCNWNDFFLTLSRSAYRAWSCSQLHTHTHKLTVKTSSTGEVSRCNFHPAYTMKLHLMIWE